MKAIVLTGDGINCEKETAEALRLSGFQADIRHLNDVISERMNLDALSRNYQVLALPGGFSFGDDVSSGKLFALKIRHGLGWDLTQYAERGGLVIGICNGFQALIKMGVFGKLVSITHNDTGRFINQWVRLSPRGDRCQWVRGLGEMELPIRHGEGKVCYLERDREEVENKFELTGRSCLKYKVNPNGSDGDIAGLCDQTGRIFGLMPHPEAFLRWNAHPEWTRDPDRAGAPGHGLAIFENAYRAAKESK